MFSVLYLSDIYKHIDMYILILIFQILLRREIFTEFFFKHLDELIFLIKIT